LFPQLLFWSRSSRPIFQPSAPFNLSDLLHPNEQGYRVWAEGMEFQLKALLGE